MIERLCGDREAEHAALDALIAGLDAAPCSTPTPAEGWAVRDQVSHLTYFDGTAHLALVDPAALGRHAQELLRVVHSGATLRDTELGRSVTGGELLGRWRAGRAQLIEAARAADPSARGPWYAQPMGLARP